MNGLENTKRPNIARASGVNPEYLSVKKYHGNPTVFPHLTKLIWKQIDFDTFNLFSTNRDVPDGDILIPEIGYYRFSSQISFSPDSDRKSMYYLLHFHDDARNDNHVCFSNIDQHPGMHPTISLDTILYVNNTNYIFSFSAYSYVGVLDSTINAGTQYAWACVEFIGR